MKRILFASLITLSVVISLFGCSNSSDVGDVDVDIDLSELSMTMMQAEYQRIFSNAEEHIGKTIKVYGSYYTMQIDNAGNIAHFVIVIPGDACCQLGFEFKRDDGSVFPDDYPVQNSMILITGTLDVYEQFGASYIYIDVDEFTIANS